MSFFVVNLKNNSCPPSSQRFQLWWQWNLLLYRKLPECLILALHYLRLIPYPLVIYSHFLHMSPFHGLFRLQHVLLFDPLDATTSRISAILQSPSSLFHPNDFLARQSTHFQCSIEISHGYRD